MDSLRAQISTTRLIPKSARPTTACRTRAANAAPRRPGHYQGINQNTADSIQILVGDELRSRAVALDREVIRFDDRFQHVHDGGAIVHNKNGWRLLHVRCCFRDNRGGPLAYVSAAAHSYRARTWEARPIGSPIHESPFHQRTDGPPSRVSPSAAVRHIRLTLATLMYCFVTGMAELFGNRELAIG